MKAVPRRKKQVDYARAMYASIDKTASEILQTPVHREMFGRLVADYFPKRRF